MAPPWPVSYLFQSCTASSSSWRDLGSSAAGLGLVLALVAWLAAYRASFDTSRIRALAIGWSHWLVMLVFDLVLVALVGVSIPALYPS
jgi:hypothetical protein